MSILFFLSEAGTDISVEAGTVAITGADANVIGGEQVIVPLAGTVSISGVDASVIGGISTIIPLAGTVAISGVDALVGGTVPDGAVSVSLFEVDSRYLVSKFYVRPRYKVRRFRTVP